MKRLLPLLSLLTVTFVLSSCVVVGEMPLKITDASYRTEFFDPDTGQYYICDDRETRITYSFSYDGTLESWTSYLVGSSNNRGYVRPLTLESPNVTVEGDGRVVYSFTVGPETAPLGVVSQAIVPKARTNLVIEAEGISGQDTVRIEGIPVVANCS